MTQRPRLTEDDVLLPTYGPRPIRFDAGHGSWLVAEDGTEYLDFLCGLAVTSLGHAHPAVTAAISQQAARLTHVSNLFGTTPALELADRLRTATGWTDAKTFFCSSGAEANEAAIKLARRHGKASDPSKVKVIALEGGFHGRLMGALKLTGNPAKHAPFEPLGDWVVHVPHDDPDALTAAVDAQTCAVWLEVVQGEGGVRVLEPEVLRAAREACDAHGALLVIDEVQTGIGRLGTWFGFQGTEIDPDVICLAKGLANGLPIGAIVAHGQAAKAFGPGDHATTFGGGPVVAAAANAVMATIDEQGLLDNTVGMGQRLVDGLDALGLPQIRGHRGRGLLRALVLDGPIAAQVTEASLSHHLIVNTVAPDAVRMAPPLNVSAAEIDEGVRRLADAITTATSKTGTT